MGSHKEMGSHGQKNKKIPCVYFVKILKNSFSLLLFEDSLVFSHQQLIPPINRHEKDGAEFCNSSEAISCYGKDATSELNAWSRQEAEHPIQSVHLSRAEAQVSRG